MPSELAALDPSFFGPNSVHVSAAGHARIAALLAQALT